MAQGPFRATGSVPVMNPSRGSPGGERRLALDIAWVLAGAYMLFALVVMWRAPRVPYADGWRFLGRFAAQGFPENIFTADNGHHEVLPNAVRVLDMHIFGADQGLQVVVGIALLLASLATAWSLLRRLPSPQLRAAAVLVLAVGLCWLGNVRALSHANESVHAYAVTLFLLLGTGVLVRRDGPPTAGDAGLASLCGLLAALSFGSGIAVFAAYLVVAFLRRGSWRVLCVLCVSAIAVFVLLREAGGGAGLPPPAPVRQLDLALRWLAAPWLYAAWPVVDPAVADRIPIPLLQALSAGMASGWESLFGPVTLSRWPHIVISGLGVTALVLSTLRCWQQRSANRARLAGLALAWFALAVGGMVASVRMAYFDIHPEQVMATRYVVWSSLFWAGLGISMAAAAPRPGRAVMMAVAVALALLPSQLWMGQLAESLRRAADQTAVAAAAGVLDPELTTGETVPAELAVALPPLRRMQTSVFAWPESRVLGKEPPESAVPVPVRKMVVEPVGNLLGEPGRRVRMQADGLGGVRLLLLDPDGIIRGLAIPEDGGGAGAWIGWMQGGGPEARVRVLRLAD